MRPKAPGKRALAAFAAFASGKLEDMPKYRAPRKNGPQPESLVNKAFAKWAALRRDMWMRRNRRRLVEMQPGVKILWGWGETGASDWAGAKSFVIGPEHVGMLVAQLVVVEIKTDSGRASEAQVDFIKQVHAIGGLGGIGRNAEDFEAIAAGDKTLLR